MSRRGVTAGIVLILWLGGLVVLGRRELFRSPDKRLEDASLRISPGRLFYTVDRDGRQVGFALSAIDTADGGIEITEQLEAELPDGASGRHVVSNALTRLTRGLRLRDYRSLNQSANAQVRVNAQLRSDTLVQVVTSRDSTVADTQAVRVESPVILPSLLPLTVGLGDRLNVGRTVALTVFDPTARTSQPVTLSVDAESLFVISDSVVQDSATKIWSSAHEDTVRAWRVTSTPPGPSPMWIDAQGRVVQTTGADGMRLLRTTFDLAYSNWHRPDATYGASHPDSAGARAGARPAPSPP